MANDPIPEGAERPNVLHALTRKRAQLAGQIERCQFELSRLAAELKHIDAAIRIFNPEINIGVIRSKPVRPRCRASTGEVTQIVFDLLRDADGSPVTSRDIALTLMNNRGLNPNNRELTLLMVRRVCACLRNNRKKGFVRTVPSLDDFQGWVLA
jgi:hypothetical protein